MLNKEKGITLIALIITIIVMLILVGVTINVALNGGLFEKAETATTETKKALEKEELMQIVLAEYDVKSDVVNADNVKTQATNYTEDTSKSKAGKTLVLKGKSGIFWEINLETAQVKEYEEVTVTSTIWAQRRVTSPNVKFDTLYYDDEVYYDNGGYNGLAVCLFENGDVCVNMGTDVVSAFDEEGNHILGKGGLTSEACDEYLANPDTPVRSFSNGITFPNGSDIITIRYTSENTIKVYFKDSEDNTIELIDGNVPENEDYIIGTLLPQ